MPTFSFALGVLVKQRGCCGRRWSATGKWRRRTSRWASCTTGRSGTWRLETPSSGRSDLTRKTPMPTSFWWPVLCRSETRKRQGGKLIWRAGRSRSPGVESEPRCSARCSSRLRQAQDLKQRRLPDSPERFLDFTKLRPDRGRFSRCALGPDEWHVYASYALSRTMVMGERLGHFHFRLLRGHAGDHYRRHRLRHATSLQRGTRARHSGCPRYRVRLGLGRDQVWPSRGGYGNVPGSQA